MTSFRVKDRQIICLTLLWARTMVLKNVN